MIERTSSCVVCGSSIVSTVTRGRLPRICSPACRAVHVRSRLRAWRADNPERTTAYVARRRAGRTLFVEVPCLVCGRPVAQPRKRVGRHKRTCSETCRRERDRRRRQRDGPS